VPLTLALVREKLISKQRFVELLSVRPAQILGIPGGSLAPGEPADITVINPEDLFCYSEESVVSKSKNSPFLNWNLQGRAVLTMVGGKVTHNLFS